MCHFTLSHILTRKYHQLNGENVIAMKDCREWETGSGADVDYLALWQHVCKLNTQYRVVVY